VLPLPESINVPLPDMLIGSVSLITPERITILLEAPPMASVQGPVLPASHGPLKFNPPDVPVIFRVLLARVTALGTV